MKKILPIILIVLGITGGMTAGVFLKPAEQTDSEAAAAAAEAEKEAELAAAPRSFVKIGRQTIVPVVEEGETRALMMFELGVDVPAGQIDKVHEMEPRLRDAFLRELFQMSYTGAFLTNFTDDRIIEELRRNLTGAARKHLGHDHADVLILDVMRQEM